MMRIAFVTPEYVTEDNFDGGLANYLHRLVLALEQMGHQAVVVVASSRDEILYHQDIEVHRVQIERPKDVFYTRAVPNRLHHSLHYLLQSWRLNQRVGKIHRTDTLDVVQYTNLEGVGLFRRSELSVIIRISSYTPMVGLGYNVSTARQQHFLETMAMRRADGVFCPSQMVAEIVEQKTGIPVRVIESPFLLDAHTYDDISYHIHLAGKPYLLFFGTIGVLKGVLTIAEILPTVLARHHELYFVFIGKEAPGQHEGLSIMEYVWKKAGPQRDRVLYLGKMCHERLYPILARALAVVLPSRVDNFPNTCLEAMAHRRVVIGTYGTSFEQLIVDGQNGFLCKIDDAASLLDAIERSLSLTYEQREQMGANAARRIDELKPEQTVTKLLDFYDEIIKMYRR